MTQDDLLHRFRLRVFAMAAELGNVRAACRATGIPYYRWKRQLDRYGPEILRPRERRVPRMANQTSVLVEQRVVAFALGHPSFGPARIAAELAQPRWGQIRLLANGVWRVLRRHGLQTRARRYGLVAGYAAPPAPERLQPPPGVTGSTTIAPTWRATPHPRHHLRWGRLPDPHRHHPRAMASLRNLAIAILRLGGWRNIAAALRRNARDATRVLPLLGITSP